MWAQKWWVTTYKLVVHNKAWDHCTSFFACFVGILDNYTLFSCNSLKQSCCDCVCTADLLYSAFLWVWTIDVFACFFSVYMYQTILCSLISALDYVFACFVGIYVSSTIYFLIYIIIKKNKPAIYPRAILPGVISGLMWGTATTCWFVANKALSEAVAFPIVTSGPSVVASLWGVFVFKEITVSKIF